jgi:hypothetical protein
LTFSQIDEDDIERIEKSPSPKPSKNRKNEEIEPDIIVLD